MGSVSEMVVKGRGFISERAKRLMFFEHASSRSFEETVETVTAAAKEQGWHVLGVNDLQRTYQDAGHPEMTKVQTVELCNPDGAVRILDEDGNKRLAAMLPIQIAVYETHAGDVRVSGMNLGLMSRMFGGVIEKVTRQGAQDVDRTLMDVVERRWAPSISPDAAIASRPRIPPIWSRNTHPDECE